MAPKELGVPSDDVAGFEQAPTAHVDFRNSIQKRGKSLVCVALGVFVGVEPVDGVADGDGV